MRRIISIVLAAIMVMAMSTSVFAAGTTKQGAEKIALKNAKLSRSKVTILKSKYDREDGLYEIKFRKKSNGAIYEFEIRKSSGKIVEKSIDYKYKRTSSRKKVGKLKAQKTASKKSGVKLAAVKKGTCKYEYDDGQGTYEVKFKSKNYRYDVEIQAATGKVMDYSWEYIGR